MATYLIKSFFSTLPMRFLQSKNQFLYYAQLQLILLLLYSKRKNWELVLEACAHFSLF
jgi:hypothetical protein